MKKIAVYAAALLMLCGAAARAQAVPEIDCNVDTGIVCVTGALGEELAESTVSLTVYKTDAGMSDTALTADGTLNWYAQTAADKTGAYNFSFAMLGERGVKYTFSIAADGLDGAEEKEFVYYPREEASAVILPELAAAKQSGDADRVLALVQTYKDFLQLDMSHYSALDEAMRRTACTNLLAAELTSIPSFKKAFSDCSTIVYLNGIDDAALYETELIKFLEPDAPTAVRYFGKSDLKSSIINTMMATDYKLKSEMLQYFNDTVFAAAANKAEVWGDMLTLLTDAKAELGIDLGRYDRLGSRGADAIKLMLGKVYKSCADIKKGYDTAVAAIGNTSSDNSSSGGGGGGGGSVATLPQTVGQTEYFGDLSTVEWARESINALRLKGIVSGDENGNFNPGRNVSRAEYVKMLVCALGMSGYESGLAFADVPEGAWYYDYVMTAAANGLVSGVGADSFGPDMNITRQDAAVIIYRAAGLGAAGDECDIADENEISDYAKDAVRALYKSGILSGVGDGRFAPKNNMTKAEAAVVICKFINRAEVAN